MDDKKNTNESQGIALIFWVWHDIPLYAPGRDRILDGPWLRATELILMLLTKILYFFEKTSFKLQMKLVWGKVSLKRK